MDDDTARRLVDLDARIAAARKTDERAPHPERKFRGAEMAWRMVIDLVAGVGLGVGVGYGLDSFLGTMPAFLILFTLLGFAAGVKVMLRSAAEYQEKINARQSADAEGGTTG